MRKTDGVITVYAGTVTVLILSAVLALLESARFYVCETCIGRYADTAAEMTFSGYCLPLAERYGLYAVDAGQGGEGLQVFDAYLARNLAVSEENEGRIMALYAEPEGSAVITGTGFEEGGWSGLTEQIRILSGYEALDTALTGLMQLIREWQSADAAQEAEDYAGQIGREGARAEEAAETAAEESAEASSKTEGKAAPEEKPEPVSDPREGIGTWLRRGLIHLVLGDRDVSGKTVDLARCSYPVSGTRKPRTTGEFLDYHAAEQSLTAQSELLSQASGPGAADHLLLDLYILNHFGSLVSPQQKESGRDRPYALEYETEYILFGKASDEENLACTLAALQGVRSVLNLIYLRSDPALKAQLEEAALLISSAAGLPAAVWVVELLLGLCWANAEAVVDCASLAEGGRVPIWKDDSTWSLTLEQLGTLAREGGSPAAYARNVRGLTYDQYLAILVVLMPAETRIRRMLNMMEMNIRLEEGYDAFCIRSCVTSARFDGQARINSAFGFFGISRDVSYQTKYSYVSGGDRE